MYQKRDINFVMVATGQEMVRGKILQGQGKSGNFTSSQGKFESLKEVRKKWDFESTYLLYTPPPRFCCFLTLSLNILLYILRTWIMLYSKTPQLRTWILRTCWARICQLSSYLYKNLFNLKFETGSFFSKIYEKILHTWVNEISQLSESSLKTKVPYHSNCNVNAIV